MADPPVARETAALRTAINANTFARPKRRGGNTDGDFLLSA